MLAVVVDEPGGVEQLRLAEWPQPVPGEHELLVRVRATAVNRADLLQRRGLYPPPHGASPLLGLELAGEVVARGAAVHAIEVGARVCGIVAGGAYAEYALLPAACAIPIPEAMSFVDAAAFPEVWLTAYDALFWRGRVRTGERVLVHGGASGVGTAAIQLAARAGAEVIVTVGSNDKGTRCLELGARRFINYRTHRFADELADIDVVLDLMGASYLDANLRVLRTEGRLVIIGLQGGVHAELDLMKILRNRLQITGATLRARTVEEKAALTEAVIRDVLPALRDGSLRVVVDRVLPLDQVRAAHTRIEASEHVGKIVLEVP